MSKKPIENEALVRVEKALASILRASPLGVGLVSNRVLKHVNERVCEMTGYSYDELVGQSSRILYPSQEEFERVGRVKYEQIDKTGSGTIETTWKKKDGRLIGVLLSSSALEPADLSKGVTFTALEITERQQAETSLRESEERYRRIVDSSPLGMHMYKLEDDRLIFTGANPAADNVLGVENIQFVGKEITEAFPPLKDTNVPERYAEAARNGTPWMTEQIDYEHGAIAGAFEVHAFQTEPGHMVAMFHDITERKLAETETRRLAAAVDSAAESILITGADGKIQYVNPHFEKLTGYKPSEVIGKDPGILNSGRHDKEFYDQLWKTISGGGTWRGRFMNKRKDGQIFEEEAVISPVTNSAGDIVNYVAVKRDITREKLLENQVRQSQKMAALGQLAQKITHDFTNALTAIVSNAELAAMLAGARPDICERLDFVVDAARRVSSLTAELLAFAQPARIRTRSISLDRIVHGVEEMLTRTLPPEVRVIIDTSGDPGKVEVDPNLIEQIIVHMVINSSESMPEGGTLTISSAAADVPQAEIDRLDSRKASAPRAQREFGMLKIHDTGCGMDHDTLLRLYEPFFSTKPKEKNPGLGLTTVYKIVDQHDGHILVESEVGKGTTFRVLLPLA